YLTTGQIPLADTLYQAYHPPLYTLLGAPWMAIGGDKAVQFMSMLMSIATLVLLYRYVAYDPQFKDRRYLPVVLLLAACIPALLTFGGIISNDSLSFLLGVSIYLQSLATIRVTNWRNTLVLATVLGLGLLTKGSFLAFIPVVGLTVLASWWRRHQRPGIVLKVALAFAAITMAVGGYKYLQNYRYFGNPLLHNQDIFGRWHIVQGPVWNGWRNSLSFNVWRLREQPLMDESLDHYDADTMLPIPLLFYATFWHPVQWESSLWAVGHWRAQNLPQLLFLSGTSVFALAALGFALSVWQLLSQPRLRTLCSAAGDQLLEVWLAVGLTVMCLILVVTAGLKYDLYSCFHSRLMLPTLPAFLFFFYRGISCLKALHPRLPGLAAAVCLIPILLAIARFGYEFNDIIRQLDL
ncbi:MAG: ArnT family glycosyltransferase, partial [Puniceicoccales bacterium]